MRHTNELKIHFEPLDEERAIAERAVRETHEELAQLGLRAVRPEQEAPSDSKSGTHDLLTLLLDVSPWASVLSSVINASVYCLKRRMMRAVIIELNGNRLEIRGPWSEDKLRLAEKWIEEHSIPEEDEEE
ncbi:hypothetical protein FHX80_114721 [Streptomyces brevispora]|uniref:Uncharacterized protein n=2 Tax=Streptomyces TaxID=1883 RepID=A0A561V3N4_9ACTN|nr:hypothetical protein FHX80_114721 [Streptomyces brevispora]